jgi:hypothetical protein
VRTKTQKRHFFFCFVWDKGCWWRRVLDEVSMADFFFSRFRYPDEYLERVKIICHRFKDVRAFHARQHDARARDARVRGGNLPYTPPLSSGTEKTEVQEMISAAGGRPRMVSDFRQDGAWERASAIKDLLIFLVQQPGYNFDKDLLGFIGVLAPKAGAAGRPSRQASGTTTLQSLGLVKNDNTPLGFERRLAKVPQKYLNDRRYQALLRKEIRRE